MTTRADDIMAAARAEGRTALHDNPDRPFTEEVFWAGAAVALMVTTYRDDSAKHYSFAEFSHGLVARNWVAGGSQFREHTRTAFPKIWQGAENIEALEARMAEALQGEGASASAS